MSASSSLSSRAARQAQRRFYGKYRAFVADNADPSKLGRVKLRVPSVFGDEISNWALPVLPFGGKAQQGLFLVPEVDAQVWAEFEEGNPDAPLWVGVFWQQTSDVPEEASKDTPTTRLLKTPAGHLLVFDDEKGAERVRLVHGQGAELCLDEHGSVLITDNSGARIELDAQAGSLTIEDKHGNKLKTDSSSTLFQDKNGNQLKMAGSQVTLKGTTIVIDGQQVGLGGAGGEPLLKGATFLSLFATHVHTCTAPGSPSSPPVAPLPPSVLTTKSKAS